MKKYFYILAAIGCLSLAATANAQLPANPWSPNPNDGYFGDNLPEKDLIRLRTLPPTKRADQRRHSAGRPLGPCP